MLGVTISFAFEGEFFTIKQPSCNSPTLPTCTPSKQFGAKLLKYRKLKYCCMACTGGLCMLVLMHVILNETRENVPNEHPKQPKKHFMCMTAFVSFIVDECL